MLYRQSGPERLRVSRRNRSGSVLILVVALLVLLALIGTAFLTTTQTERFTADQNSVNTQGDLYITGVTNSVAGMISNTLYAGTTNGLQYRPPSQEMPLPANGNVNSYPNLDSTAVNLFQADRTPTNTDIRAFGTTMWSNISWPLNPSGNGNYVFSSPFGGTVNLYAATNRTKIVAIPASRYFNGQIYPGMILWVPPGTVANPVTITTPTGTLTSTGSGIYLTPTGFAYTPPTSSTYASYVQFAGDAAGTGVADSCFYKLPGGPINGVTYYAAYRVVDNNSAVNASSAWTMQYDQGSPVTPGSTSIGASTTFGANMGFFRSGVGLVELLAPGGATEIANLNNYRQLGALPGTIPPGGVNQMPVNDPVLGGPATVTTSNWQYWSLGDVMEQQLARRGGNPGYSSITTQCKWLGPTETATMAYKGGALVNPYTSPSVLEQCLPNEVIKNVPTTPYGPDQAQAWFANTYNYYNSTTLTNNMPLRPLLVGSNAVSIACKARYGNAAASSVPVWSQITKYNLGDWVKDANGRSYLCVESNTGQPLPTSAAYNVPTKYWTAVPFTTQPIKTSINTANFQQLYLGFAQTMADSQTVASAGQVAVFEPPMVQPAPAANVEPQLPMFRSVFRNPNATAASRLRPDQMLQLRAALAAVNTIDLRDSDDNVTSKRIELTDLSGNAQYEVEVYGTEKQPYISEVFLHLESPNGQQGGQGGQQDPPKPYMAVKLCNPYRTPITLTNWYIAPLNRQAYPNLTMGPGIMIPTVTIPAATAAGVPGIVVMEDSLSNEPKDVHDTIINNQLVYSGTDAQPVQVTGMETATFGNELCLLRPRRADGTLSKSLTDPNDSFDETNPALSVADFVPVDQFDMTGLVAPQGNQPPVRYLYRRACRGDTVSKSWNMIFPGYYNVAATTTGRYFQDTKYATPAIINDPSDSVACNLNAPDGSDADGTGNGDANGSTYPTVPLQLNNAFMAGPNKLGTVAGPNTYPFGGFARNGDMQQITYIGAYRITPVTNQVQGVTQILELNSVTTDSAMANDINAPHASATNTPASPFQEQIGRFCMVGNPQLASGTGAISAASAEDFFEGVSAADVAIAPQYWHYHWTRRLFDYFTVQCPADQYFPNVDPAGENTYSTPAVPAKYPDQDAVAAGQPVVPISGDGVTYNDSQPPTVTTAGIPIKSQDQYGIEGLININTAPWPVLATLPYVPYGTRLITYNIATDSVIALPSGGTSTVDDNTYIAQAIVAYRTKNGPFKSIEDLLKVPAVQVEMQQFLIAEPGPAQGSFSPGGIGAAASPSTTSGARLDFHERFLIVNRVSNLITTHSDTFTCYVLLQGWRNVDTSNPTLAIQRRSAFLVDRTTVNASNNRPVTFKVPTD